MLIDIGTTIADQMAHPDNAPETHVDPVTPPQVLLLHPETPPPCMRFSSSEEVFTFMESLLPPGCTGKRLPTDIPFKRVAKHCMAGKNCFNENCTRKDNHKVTLYCGNCKARTKAAGGPTYRDGDAFYCSKECQRLDWPQHKLYCKRQ
jgi:hypothetical protein